MRRALLGRRDGCPGRRRVAGGPSTRSHPFASYDLGNGWSAGLSELTYTYNFKQGKWLDLPIGGRIEKLVQLGNLPVRLYFDTEYNLNDSGISPRVDLPLRRRAVIVSRSILAFDPAAQRI